jgi:hypothetical protein
LAARAAVELSAAAGFVMGRLSIAVFIGALGAASAASAFSFSPVGTSFTISGQMSFGGGGVGVDCKTFFAGQTGDDGVAQITAASFSGGTLSVCDGIHPLDLPWTVRARDQRSAVVSLISVRAPVFGDCAVRDVTVAVGRGGSIHVGHIDMPPRCTIYGGDLKPNMVVSIVP